MALIRPNDEYKYSDKGNRIYTPLDRDIYLKNPHVALNGDIIWDAIEICPKEGWLIVLEHTDGNNFNRESVPKLPEVPKKLYGKVEIGEVTIAHGN